LPISYRAATAMISTSRLGRHSCGDNRQARAGSLTAQKRLVEAGFGLALLVASSIEDELQDGALAAVDIPDLRADLPVVLAQRRGGLLSPAAMSLRDELQAQMARSFPAAG
jgi:DNA-binding transcriptional LysR family regulator